MLRDLLNWWIVVCIGGVTEGLPLLSSLTWSLWLLLGLWPLSISLLVLVIFNIHWLYRRLALLRTSLIWTQSVQLSMNISFWGNKPIPHIELFVIHSICILKSTFSGQIVICLTNYVLVRSVGDCCWARYVSLGSWVLLIGPHPHGTLSLTLSVVRLSLYLVWLL